MNNQVYEHIVNVTPEFLDDICEVNRLTKQWTMFDTQKHGIWAYQGDTPLLKVEDPKIFMKERGLENRGFDSFVSSVRDLVGAKAKIAMPTNVDIETWLNVILPLSNPLDINDVRVEAYIDKSAALRDADDERVEGVSVFTLKNKVNLSLTNPKPDENPLVVGTVEGITHPTEIVEMILDENTYLRNMLRGMLKLIPANDAIEYAEKLEPPFKESVTDDRVEEVEEQFREYGERLEKLLDLVKDAQPPKDWKEGDKAVWENAVDNAVHYLNGATPKNYTNTVTVAEIRDMLD